MQQLLGCSERNQLNSWSEANTDETICRDPVTTRIPGWFSTLLRIWYAIFIDSANDFEVASKVLCSNTVRDVTNWSSNISRYSAIPLWTVMIPNSSEAWIQRSLNKEAGVTRAFPPATSASVRMTESNFLPEEM